MLTAYKQCDILNTTKQRNKHKTKKEVQSKGDSSFGKEQPQQTGTIDEKPVVN